MPPQMLEVWDIGLYQQMSSRMQLTKLLFLGTTLVLPKLLELCLIAGE